MTPVAVDKIDFVVSLEVTLHMKCSLFGMANEDNLYCLLVRTKLNPEKTKEKKGQKSCCLLDKRRMQYSLRLSGM